MPFHFPLPIKGESTDGKDDIEWKRIAKERVLHPVATPVADPLPSYWLPKKDIKYWKEFLPETADIVIVGSGISGAMIAYNLLKEDNQRTIVMLEARGVCSGATGRNGGHTKAAVYMGYKTPKPGSEIHKIIQLQDANIKEMHKLANELGEDVGNKKCGTVDVFYNEEVWRTNEESAATLQSDTDRESELAHTSYDRSVLPDRAQCFGAINDERKPHGVMEYGAGQMSGYKLVRAVLKKCVEMGLKIITYCPVIGLDKNEFGCHVVKTVRGKIATIKVVLATNAWTASVSPDFQNVLIPIRGDVVAVRAGSEIHKHLDYESISLIYSNEDFDYMIVKSEKTGDDSPSKTFILGGGLSYGPQGSLYSISNINDGDYDKEKQEYLRNLLPSVFGDKWGTDDPKGRVMMGWSGVMGFTLDGVPLIGEVPGKKGIWASVGFQGHGMALALKCAEALVAMMEGKEESIKDWFPKAFKITERRMDTKEFWDNFDKE